MDDKRLWAPWRLAYITGDQSESPDEALAPERLLPGADPSCFICRATAANDDRRLLVVRRRRHWIAILNRYPYNNGHLLLAPHAHKARLDQLSGDEQLELVSIMAEMVQRLERLMNAEGFNVGLNLGRVAGAGLPGHLHWHIVPRWNGDTNFMPSIAGIKVIPQSLDSLWELLTSQQALDLDPAS